MRAGKSGIQDFSGIKAFCDGFQVPLTIIPTEIGKIVFETRHESNPCSLCAKMRKGALNLEAKTAGCNKIAYAHHKDDIIETMLLSLMYEGRFYTFPPKTFLDRTELTVIRPLMYVSEADVIGFKNKYQLPVCKNPCPADGHTKRRIHLEFTIFSLIPHTVPDRSYCRHFPFKTKNRDTRSRLSLRSLTR